MGNQKKTELKSMIFSITKRFIHQTFVIVIIISHLTYQSGIEKKTAYTFENLFIKSSIDLCSGIISFFIFSNFIRNVILYLCKF